MFSHNILNDYSITSYTMRKITITLLAIFVTCSISLGQQKKDTLFVKVINKYVLVNGQKTSKFYPIGQEFRDTLNRLLNVINFDDSTHMVTTYSRYSYKGMNRIKEEDYSQNKLQWVTTMEYDANGAMVAKTIKRVTPKDTVVYLSITYTNIDGRPVQERGYTAVGKTAYSAKLTYDKQGQLILKKVKVKGVPPLDSILFLKRVVTYDSLQRIVRENFSEKLVGGEKQFSYKNSYEKEGFLNEVQQFDAAGKLFLRKEFIYNLQRKRIQELKTFDGIGNLLEWRAFRYERYGSQPYNVRVID